MARPAPHAFALSYWGKAKSYSHLPNTEYRPTEYLNYSTTISSTTRFAGRPAPGCDAGVFRSYELDLDVRASRGSNSAMKSLTRARTGQWAMCWLITPTRSKLYHPEKRNTLLPGRIRTKRQLVNKPIRSGVLS